MKITPELFFPLSIIVIIIGILIVDIIIVLKVETWKKCEKYLRDNDKKVLLIFVIMIRWIALIVCPIPALAIWISARDKQIKQKKN